MVFTIATITKVIKYTVMLFLWLDNILLIIKYIPPGNKVMKKAILSQRMGDIINNTSYFTVSWMIIRRIRR